MSKGKKKIRPNLEEYDLGDKKLYLIGEGRLVNLVAAEGHPSEVMDLSFAGQLMALISLAQKKIGGENKVYTLPYEIDQEIAEIKLASMGYSKDALSKDQISYLSAYDEGT